MPPPPGHACATPDGNWDQATTATVEVGRDPPQPNDVYNEVDIEQVRWTLAEITICRDRYPNGAVILNDNPRPAHANPACTHDYPDDVKWIESDQQCVNNIPITQNAGWPTITIITWLPLQG